LLISALLIGLCTLFYTNWLVKNLADRERKQVDLYAKSLKFAISPENNGSMNFLFESIIENNSSIPVILTDENHQPLSSKNVYIDSSWSEEKKTKYLVSQIAVMKDQYKPILVDYPGLDFKNYIYYENSLLLTQLKYYPFIQLIAIAVFVLIAYLAFSYSRRSEQDKVWVGMSKETAHQLGTPLSGLMAWVEILKGDERLEGDTIINEIEKDVNRLATITERFSNIGSLPTFKQENIVEMVAGMLDYLRLRVGRNVDFTLENHCTNENIHMNKALFEWVVENITKNAIDAMGGKGKLNISIVTQNHQTIIDITDSGKGIPKKQFEKVFQPGFTTKQRGWGLGLTLVKRIVEEYHKGKIYVKWSEVGKGTTFRIII
jgi:two-component system, sporulation sensor kinase E